MAMQDNHNSLNGLISRLSARSGVSGTQPAAVGKATAFLFRIAVLDGAPCVDVVDEKGNPVDTDELLTMSMAEQVALNSYRNIIESQRFNVRWDNAGRRVSLYRYPYLLPLLLSCPNLVNVAMTPLKQDNEPHRIQLCFDTLSDKTLQARLDLPGSEQKPWTMLSDDCVMCGDRILRVASVGPAFADLRSFEIALPEDQLFQFLTIFYSWVNGVQLNHNGLEITDNAQPLALFPTLWFERVDSDLSLYVSFTATLPDYDLPDTPIPLRCVISPIGNHTAERRQLAWPDMEAEISSIDETLTKSLGGQRAASQHLYRDGNTLIMSHKAASAFLISVFPTLQGRFRILGAERLREYKVKYLEPKLKLNVSSGIDFLEGKAEIDLDGEQLSWRDFLTQFKQKRYIELSDGSLGIVDDRYVKRLERLFVNAGKRDGQVKISYFDMPEVEALLGQRVQGKMADNLRDFYEGINGLATRRMKYNTVQAKLRNYQKEGVKWLNHLHEHGFGGCLADDMGLGKTLQAITMLSRVYPDAKRPSLVIMPKSLLFNWQDELDKFAPQLKYYVYYGTQRDLEQACASQLILTTYALIRNDIKKWTGHEFEYIILDESQNIKNIESQASKAVALLKGKHRLALSGTPIENNLMELYSLFRFLNPTMFGTPEEFNTRYALPIQRDGDKPTMDALRRRISPFMLRRLKRDVLTELPERTSQTLMVEMEPKHAAFYEQRRAYYSDLIHNAIMENGVKKSQFVMFQALSELRRVASVPESLTDGTITSPKLQPLIDSLLEAVAGGHKVVVFFNFIAGIELVGEQLAANGIDYTTMTGSTTDRRAVVERFQNEANCKVLLMTIKTGGVGLNLTVADTVYIFEPWWNKAAEEQAINRLHRIGQKAKVLSLSIITQDTIEEKIRQLQQQKADLFSSVITDDTSIAKHLSEEDIQFILS